MTTKDRTTLNQEFLQEIKRACDDRGQRAALRRYWSETTRHQSYPVLGKLGALSDERKTILVTLFAEHIGETSPHRSGIGVGQAALGLGDRSKDGDHPYDRHFRRLIACDTLKELGEQLHRLVKRLKQNNISLDYAELHKNLNYWSDYRDNVKVDWAKQFWQTPQMEASKKEVTA